MENELSYADNQVFLVQKTVGLVMALLAFIICIVNLVYSNHNYSIIDSLLRPSVIVLFGTALLMLLICFLNNKIARAIQVFIGFFTGALAILDKYDAIFGLGLFILFAIVAFKYGFFKKFPRVKIACGIGAIYVLTIISAKHMGSSMKVMLGVDTLLYITIFLVVLYVIYSNEIKGYIARNQAAESTISKLLGQRAGLEKQLAELNHEIESLMHDNETIDFDACGITERERDVLYALVVYKDTGKEIAERLEIGHETVKTHLKHIRDKLGVDRRDEIIELCRNNFIKEGNNI